MKTSRKRWDRLSVRQRKWIGWLAGLFLVYTLVGFFLLPVLIRWQALKHLPGVLKREVAVRQVRFNPWTLSLAVRGLAVTEPDGRAFVSWEEFYINFQSSSLLRWAWTFKEVRLVNPFGEVIVDADGRPNFSNLLSAAGSDRGPTEPSAGIPRLGVNQLMITNGVFAFEDRTRRTPFRTEYRPINLKLSAFKTKPNANSPHSFEAVNDSGKRIGWSGAVTVQPLRATGTLELTGIDLARYHPYLEDQIRARLAGGSGDVHLEYRFESGTNGTDLVVSNGVVQLVNLRFDDPETTEPPVAVATLRIDQLQPDLRAQTLRMGALDIAGVRLLARLDGAGRLNLVDLFRPAGPVEPPPDQAPDGAGDRDGTWTVDVDRLRLSATVAFEDLSRATPFRTTWSPIDVRVDRFSTRTNAAATFEFEAQSEADEALAGSGEFSVTPPGSTGEIRLTSFWRGSATWC